MNTFLLLKVKEAILAHPENFDMGTWDCGTTACIAGWACRLGGVKIPVYMGRNERAEFINFASSKLLKLGEQESKQLFFEGRWPMKFRSHILEGPDTSAKKAAARIDHFIATEGRE